MYYLFRNSMESVTEIVYSLISDLLDCHKIHIEGTASRRS